MLDGERISWILGSSRSGSSWLLRMLAADRGVVPINETGLGHHLGVWRPISLAWATSESLPPLAIYADLKRGNPDFVFSDRHREDWEPLLARFVGERLALQWPADDPLARQMVIKEPGGSHVASWLTSLTPGCGLVFLLRDGRDVVDSWLDAFCTDGWAAAEGSYPLTEEGRLPFICWQATVWRFRTLATMQAYEAHDPARRVLIRYEDLRADPVPQLARVHAVLGTTPAPAALERAAAREAYERVPHWERGNGRAVRFAEPGRWRQTMSPDEQSAMEEIMGDLLLELDYAAAPRVAG